MTMKMKIANIMKLLMILMTNNEMTGNGNEDRRLKLLMTNYADEY